MSATNADRLTEVRAATGFAPDTFGAIATRYIQRECSRLTRGAEIASVIRRELLLPLGARPFAELRRRDLHEIVNAIADSGRLSAAHKVREVGKRIANWADDEELIDHNPFLGGKNPVRRQDRSRALSPAEIDTLWQACDTMGPPLGAFIKFALVTAQRRGEIATMERAELDLAARLWTIPAAKTKSRRLHLVPLSGLALEILDCLPAVDEVEHARGNPNFRVLEGEGPRDAVIGGRRLAAS